MKSNVIHYFVLAFLMVLLAGCNSERKSWNNAKLNNTIQAYENFIDLYPKCILADSAQLFIQKLQFHQAQSINTISAYEQFLKSYPQTIFADSIQFLIERIYFSQAESTNTLSAYQNFLEQFPQGRLTTRTYECIDKIIPHDPKITSIKILSSSSDWSRCKVSFIVTVLHKAGMISASDKPIVGIILEHEDGQVIGIAAVNRVIQKNRNTSEVHANFVYEIPYGLQVSFEGKCKMGIVIYDKDGNESKEKAAFVNFK